MNNQKTPLIAHAIFRLDVGGLENALINLINGLPADRHYSPEFRCVFTANMAGMLMILMPETENFGCYANCIVGDGELRDAIIHALKNEALGHLSWVPGARTDPASARYIRSAIAC